MKTNKPKVFVIVENGMVQSVYADKPIDLEIVDLDSQEEDEAHEAEKRAEEIEAEYKNIY